MLSRSFLAVLLIAISTADANAQVHYYPGGSPWDQVADGGPDAVVPGWYYNLGITGIRVELTEDKPEHLTVRYVFADSPAHEKVSPGDVIIGAGGKRFVTPHRNGYGMDKFGPDGPIADFAIALEACQSTTGSGKLDLTIERAGTEIEASLAIDKRYGTFSDSFPTDCPKSDMILEELYSYLLEHQAEDGSWGIPPQDTFAPLALMASGKPEHMAAVKKNVKMHARTTAEDGKSWLINWRYMAAAIVMSEYYLLTGEEWVKEELQEVYDFLIFSQYTDTAQIDPKSYETHAGAVPKGPLDSHGGWGHNPGFEGYGPISMLTGQGAIAFSLMKECGIEVDKDRHDDAYAFVSRASGENAYVWYKDGPGGANDWADMGRTGTAALANWLYPWSGDLREQALRHARVIGDHPESFPDTHGSPQMGMCYAAAGAYCNPESFRKVMDANKWWFVLAQCTDGSFYYQPNRDNAGYRADSRISATAATAFILTIPQGKLRLTGRAPAAN